MYERHPEDEEGSDSETKKMANVTVIMRKNSVDFFYNFKFLNTLNCEVEDVELTFNELYLKLKAPSFELLQQWRTSREEALIDIWLPEHMRTKDQVLSELSDKTLAELAAY